MDLEVWLIGTPAELRAALTALGTAGSVEGASVPERLYGADSGRQRRYLRVRIPITATGNRPQTRAAGAGQQRLTLPDAA